jgi:PAS domain S-box-containing protein
MWLLDVEPGERYVFRSINDAFERVTGLTRAQVLDRPMEEWFPPASLELVRSKYREAVATGRPLEYLETTVLPAGQRVGEITIIPILNAEGKCTQLLGKAHDVTEARKNAAALEATEDRYRLLADNTDDFVSLASSQGERLYVSPSFYRATGWTPEEINRTDWRTRVHPEDLPHVEAAHTANLAGRQTTIEHRVLCRDGSWIWVELNCKPLPDHADRVQSFLNCARNITARKEIEAALRHSELR